ncbi:MAG: cation transporter dimerization domain-containing protein [Paracoccaceae bacterium]
MSRRYGIAQLDSVVALIAALVLALGALRIGKGAWDALMDRRADPALVAAIGAIARDWPGVHGFHDLKTRTAGSRVFVNIHIELDGDLPLRKAHGIGAAAPRHPRGLSAMRCHRAQGCGRRALRCDQPRLAVWQPS